MNIKGMLGTFVCFLMVFSVQCIAVKDETTCRFPSYLYSGWGTWQNSPVFENEDTGKDITEVWTMLEDKTRIKIQQFDQKKDSYFFYAHHFDLSKTPISEFYLNCHSNPIQGGNYVIVEKALGNSLSYHCIGFVKRSEIVVTFSKSHESSEVQNSLCDSSLFMSPSPLVSIKLINGYMDGTDDLLLGKPYEVCPLKGGFRLESVYSTRSKKECPGRYGESSKFTYRSIENECERGSGISFDWPLHGPDDNCETLGTRMYCMASWKDKKYTYMLVSNSVGFSQGVSYCSKYLGHAGVPDDGIIMLFNGSVCDYTEDNHLFDSFVKYKVSKHNTQGHGLCSDNTELCQSVTEDECKKNHKYECAESCKFCPTPRPWDAAGYDERYRGTFQRNSLLRGKEVVDISDKVLKIPQMGKYEVLGENVCPSDKVDDYGSFSNVTTYLMLKRGDGGCISTTAMLAIKEINPSVFLYKVSQEVPTSTSFAYPRNVINRTEDWDLSDSCTMLFFHTDNFGPLHDVFHYSDRAWDVLIKDTPESYKIACAQELESAIRFTLEGGEECLGNIKPKDENTSFEFTIEKCYSSDNARVKELIGTTSTYECLANLNGKRERDGKFIITKLTGGVNVLGLNYTCWALEKGTTSGFWVPIGDCHPDVWSNIDYRNLKPLASFNQTSLLSCNTWLLFLVLAIITLSIQVNV